MRRLTCLGNDETVRILNIHAGVLASDRKKSTRKFSRLFTAFTSALQKSEFDETYPDDEDTAVTPHKKDTDVTPDENVTEVTIAYRAFLKCIKKEVKAVKPRKGIRKDVNAVRPKKCSRKEGKAVGPKKHK